MGKGRLSLASLEKRLSTIKATVTQGSKRSRSAGGAVAPPKKKPKPQGDFTVLVRKVKDEEAAEGVIEAVKGAVPFEAALQRDKKGAFRGTVALTTTSREYAETLSAQLSGKSFAGSTVVPRIVDRTAPRAPEESSSTPPSTTYFCGNLPKAQDAGDRLRNLLLQVCKAKLSHCKLLTDDSGLPNGCAIITFVKAKQARAALAAAEAGKLELDGRYLRMETKKDAATLSSHKELVTDKASCFAANLPKNLTWEQLHEVFSTFGTVEDIVMNEDADGGFNGTARIKFSSPDAVPNALRQSNALVVNRRRIRIDLNKGKLARKSQLDLTPSEAMSKTVLVTSLKRKSVLCLRAVRALMSEVGKVKYVRPATKADAANPEFPGEEGAKDIRPGSILVGFTSTAHVPLALQLQGKEVATVADDSEGPPEPMNVRVFGGGGSATAAPAQQSVKDVVFDFSYWKSSKKEWSKQKRLAELGQWNEKKGSSSGWGAKQW